MRYMGRGGIPSCGRGGSAGILVAGVLAARVLVLIFRGVGNPEGSVLDPVGGGARVSSVEQVELWVP